METILRGSPAVSAAATGKIAVPTIHVISSDQRDEALSGCWLALARIKVLEIWMDRLDTEEECGSRSSNLTLMCEREMNRIEALAAVPCGNGEDNLLAVKETLSWELLGLIVTEDSSTTRSSCDRNEMPATIIRGIYLTLVASGSFSSSPSRPLAARKGSLSPTVLLSVRSPSNAVATAGDLRICHTTSRGRKKTGEESGQNRGHPPGAHVACACDGGLTLTLFPPKDDQAKCIAVKTVHLTVPPPTSSELHWGRMNYAVVSDDVQGSEQSVGQPWPRSRAPTILDVAIMPQEEKEARIVVALLLDESGAISEATRDGLRRLTVRTSHWDPSGASAPSPGDWCIAHLPTGTRIATLAGGGLLCVGPEGATIFHEDRASLPLAGAPSRNKPRFRLKRLAKCSWGDKPIAGLTPVVSLAWLGARATPWLGERVESAGDVQDFLVADVDGELHHISIDGDCSGIDKAQGRQAEDYKHGRKTTTTTTSDLTRIEGVTITRIISSRTTTPLPRKVKFLLPVGSFGLLFAATSSPFSAVVVRVTPATRSSFSRRRELEQTAKGPGVSREHAPEWRIFEPTEPLGTVLGPVRGLAMADGTVVLGLRSSVERDPFRQEFATAGMGPTEPQQVFVEGLKAIVATGEELSGTRGSVAHPIAGLCVLEHGLELRAMVERETGLPEGCVLFAQSLAASDCSAKEGGLQIRNILFLSDRVRSRTQALAVSPDWEVTSIVQDKGFELDQHTVHLGRTEPEGLVIHVTERSVSVIEPEGLLLVGRWRPAPALPLFKTQFGDSTGSHAVVVWEGTMIILAIEATGAANGTHITRGRTVREVRRAEFDDPASALAMSAVGGANEGRALIAISFWGRSSVAILSWAPSLPLGEASASRRGTHDDSLLEEIATWCPISERNNNSSADVDTSDAPSTAAARVVVIRALTFIEFDGEQKRLRLVVGMADGIIAVADGQEYVENQSSQYGGKVERKNTGKFVTIAMLQVGRGPVELQVFRRDPGEGICSVREVGESVFVSSGDVDAVLRYCPDSGSSTPQGVWRCTQVCKAGFYSRLSVVSLPHGERSMKNGAACDHFAWLRTAEDPQREWFSLKTTLDCDGHGRDDTAFRGLLLCLGKLDREPRGSFQKKPLLQTPTHLLHVPITRSIVVACYDYAHDKTGGNFAVDHDPRGAAPVPPPCSSLSSSLRVFDADTLDERPGGPLHLIPGVRVTGMATLGLKERWKLPGWTKGMCDGDMRGVDTPSAAVGGDMIAVACCYEDDRDHRRDGDVESAPMSAARTEETLKTVVSAFEVVAYGDCSAVGEGTSRSTGGAARDNVSRTHVIGARAEQAGTSDDIRSYTSLEPLAASTEMAGACFNLEPLDRCFVVMSLDDMILVLGWSGKKSGLRPDRPTPPLRLESAASCRTSFGGCVTALGTYGGFIAVTEFLRSISVYSFDDDSRTLSVVATHSRNNLMVTALTLNVSSCRSGGGCSQRHRILTVALADRATETVAVLSCPTSKPIHGDPHEAQNRAKRCGGFNHDGSTGFAGCSNGSRPGGQGIGFGDSFVDRGGSLHCTASLRLISIWPYAETVTCLKDASSAPLTEDWPKLEHASICGEVDDMGAVFLIGTSSGTFKTVSIEMPRCCPASGMKTHGKP